MGAEFAFVFDILLLLHVTVEPVSDKPFKAETGVPVVVNVSIGRVYRSIVIALRLLGVVPIV